MAVYVDDHRSPRPGRFQGWSHLAADSDEELHVFATKIGLKREWFRPHVIMNHYDVSERKRVEAIKAGAVPMTAMDLARRVDAKDGSWPSSRGGEKWASRIRTKDGAA